MPVASVRMLAGIGMRFAVARPTVVGPDGRSRLLHHLLIALRGVTGHDGTVGRGTRIRLRLVRGEIQRSEEKKRPGACSDRKAANRTGNAIALYQHGSTLLNSSKLALLRNERGMFSSCRCTRQRR
jgi:hypothetical protein